MKCRRRFGSLGEVGSSYNLYSKCTEKYRDYFEYRLYDDPTAPKARETAFNSRPIHIRTTPSQFNRITVKIHFIKISIHLISIRIQFESRF